MTKIESSTSPKATMGERRGAPDRPDGHARAGKSSGMGEVGSLATSAALLRQKILLAQKKAGSENRPMEEGKVLLVILHPADARPSASPHPGPLVAADATLTGTERVGWLETLYTRIEQALLHSPATADGSIRLDLQLAAEGMEGLQGVEIAMSSTALDVVLSRTEGQATAEYLAATQALAERLQERFPRRIIRIHDAVAGAGTAHNAEPDGIADVHEPEGRS